MKMPTVSIIIPFFNNSFSISSAVSSVLISTVGISWELIIVDDGSTSPFCPSMLSFIPSNLIHLFQLNKGPSSARNLGASFASGDYLCFLDADDQWAPHKLQLQLSLAYLSKYRVIGSCCLSMKYFPLDKSDIFFINRWILPFKWFPHLSSVVIDRNLFSCMGGFDDLFRYGEDGEFLARLLKTIPIPILSVPLVLRDTSRPFLRKNGLSSHHLNMFLSELKIIRLHYPVICYLIYIPFLFLKYLFRLSSLYLIIICRIFLFLRQRLNNHLL